MLEFDVVVVEGVVKLIWPRCGNATVSGSLSDLARHLKGPVQATARVCSGRGLPVDSAESLQPTMRPRGLPLYYFWSNGPTSSTWSVEAAAFRMIPLHCVPGLGALLDRARQCLPVDQNAVSLSLLRFRLTCFLHK